MPPLLTNLQSSTLTIRFNRPERANAFNFEMLAALRDAFTQATRDSGIRAVVLTGAGTSFCAGHDVGEMLAAQEQGVSYQKHLQETYNPLILQIRQLEKPVLAALNGPAAGAGLGVALACDLRFAADTASFTVGFSGIGLVPDSGVSLLLPAFIGLGRAMEFSLTNQPISADRALQWGMVNRVFPANLLQTESDQFIAALIRGPIGTFGLTKRLYNHTMLPNLAEALEKESEFQEIASKGAEHANGVKRFMKKSDRKS